MSLPRYPEYKDSGVSWLGNVPAHWTRTRLKYLLDGLGAGGTPDTDNSGYWSEDGSGTPWVAIGDLSDRRYVKETAKTLTPAGIESKGLKVWPTGTLMFSMYASLGHTAELLMPAATNQAILALLPSCHVSQGFLTRWLEFLRPKLKEQASSNTQDNLNAEKVKNLLVLAPPHVEQTAIAAFLDRETAKIDALIAEQEKLIALLAEKRQATISHAVTRGLNPDAPMKDSGVAWLGDVPGHWSIRKLKSLTSRIGDGLHGTPSYVDESEYFFINGNNLVEGSIAFFENTRNVSEQECASQSIQLNQSSVLLSINGTIGNFAFYSGEKVMLGKSAAYINCLCELDRRYLAFFVQSDGCKNYFFDSLTGTTIYNLSLETIRATPVPLPPAVEQESIIVFLETETGRLNALIKQAVHGISLLKERRSALIAAAVTGQIDVRGYRPTHSGEPHHALAALS